MKKSRDMHIAEAVRDAIADACDVAAKDWLNTAFLRRKMQQSLALDWLIELTSPPSSPV